MSDFYHVGKKNALVNTFCYVISHPASLDFFSIACTNYEDWIFLFQIVVKFLYIFDGNAKWTANCIAILKCYFQFLIKLQSNPQALFLDIYSSKMQI